MSLLSPTKTLFTKGWGAWPPALVFLFAFTVSVNAQVPVDSTKTKKDINEIKSGRGTVDTTQKEVVIPVPADTGKTSAVVADTVKKHSPKKATLMSTLLPGLGQVYNRKWWKVPIIYAAFGGVGYAIGFNQHYYKDFRTALLYRLDGNPSTVDPYVGKYSSANLDELQQYYRKNRDLSIIIAIGVYALNILDATVDAHLFDFDVSKDLSLNVQPTSIYNYGSVGGGLSLTLKFKK